MVKSPYRPTSDSYGDRCGMLVFSCIKHEAITSLLEKPFDNLHFLQNISQKIQSLWAYLWGTRSILMTRSGPFVYMRYASAVGLLPWEGEMGSSRTAFSIVTSRRGARSKKKVILTKSTRLSVFNYRLRITIVWYTNRGDSNQRSTGVTDPCQVLKIS